MDIIKTQDGCIVDIDSVNKESKCDTCKYRGIQHCMQAVVTELFQAEEEILFNYKSKQYAEKL